MLCILEELIDRKIKIILFIHEIPTNIHEKISRNVIFKVLPFVYPRIPRRPSIFFPRTFFPYINAKLLTFKYQIKEVICVDPEGLIIANKLFPNLKSNYNYISFELFFLDEIKDPLIRKNKLIEISILKKKIKSLLIQDKYRLKLFLEENKPYQIDETFYMPVAPVKPKHYDSPTPKKFLINIPNDNKSLIYSGSLYKWSGLFELLSEMEKKWNNDFHLVIHNRFINNTNSAEVKEIQAYIEKGLPVSIVNLQLSYEEYIPFLKQFDVGLATYLSFTSDSHYDGKNFGEIGYSSGKFNTYMMMGIPTITTKNNSFNDLLKTYNFGYIINDFSEMSKALSSISENYDTQKHEAKRLYNEVMNPELYLSSYLTYVLSDF
ncbi:hypothetical protein AQF98_02255 [Pedobacter sp. Hv1]|nr:hypothetical protein AQF98_02255 [Pedobacter sp. Hv1]